MKFLSFTLYNNDKFREKSIHRFGQYAVINIETEDKKKKKKKKKKIYIYILYIQDICI